MSNTEIAPSVTGAPGGSPTTPEGGTLGGRHDATAWLASRPLDQAVLELYLRVVDLEEAVSTGGKANMSPEDQAVWDAQVADAQQAAQAAADAADAAEAQAVAAQVRLDALRGNRGVPVTTQPAPPPVPTPTPVPEPPAPVPPAPPTLPPIPTPPPAPEPPAPTPILTTPPTPPVVPPVGGEDVPF